MASDKHFIQVLNEEINFKLSKLKEKYTDGIIQNKNGYVLDKEGYVVNLSLAKLNLNIFPMSLLNLKRLKVIDFYNNNITEVPNGIKELNNLIILSLRGNRITKFPLGLLSHKSLISIYLDYNNIRIIPKEAWNSDFEIEWEWFHSTKRKKSISIRPNPI